MSRLYCDYNATAPLLPALQPLVAQLFAMQAGNPSAQHRDGQRARQVLETARDQVARLVGCDAGLVAFTGSATEANASALYGHLKRSGKRVLIVSAIEHPSISDNARYLEREGAAVERVRCHSNGLVDLGHLDELLATHAGDVACVAVMWANNETGLVQPVADVVATAKRAAVAVHVDAVQAIGKLEVTWSRLRPDTLTLSAHKLGAMAGAAALVGEALPPLIPGGGQEEGRRGGTPAWQAAGVFGAACELWSTHGDAWRASMRRARDAFELALPADTRVITGERVPNTSLVLVDGVRGQALLSAMDLDGVAVSHGAACATGSMDPSPVLLAMGLSDAQARSAIRVSFGPLQGEAEGAQAAAVLTQAVARLRAAFTS